MDQPYASQFNFVCFCSQTVLLNQQSMADHIKKCLIYRQSSPFFQKFELLKIEKMQRQHLIALKSEFYVFIERVDALLKAGEDRLNSSVQQVPSLYGSGSMLQQQLGNNNQIYQQSAYAPKNIETDIFKSMKQLQKLEECNVCGKQVDADIITYFDHCITPICRPCLMKQIEKDAKTNIAFFCPNQQCRKEMTQQELIQLLGKEKQDQYATIMLARQFNLIKCSACSEQGAFEKGSSITVLKDPITNQQLQQKYVEHYLNNRFMCFNQKCRTEQCKECKAIPYHLGMTCEEYKIKKSSKCCRYCDQLIHKIQLNMPEAQQDICQENECQEKAQYACNKILACKHPCPGFKNEQICSTCLNDQCCKGDQKGDDYCNICFVEGLKNAPIIQSKCGHIFHYTCILKRLDVKWNGPRIVFKFCLCPLCNSWLEFQPSQPQNLVNQYYILFQDVMKKSLDRLKYENRDKDDKVSKVGEPFYGKPQEYAMAIYCYYQCFKCKNPYFGGAKDCQRALEEGDKQYKPEELICANCCEVPVGETCQIHGKEYIEFKCKFCCQIAVWFCWGTTHFCEDCHKRQCNGDYVSKIPKEKLPKCPGKDKCPIKMDHKPNGEEQALGCAICRNQKASQQNF
ncbi:unnamed protein product [Paramecium pentaurelia]|uniref:RING-type domain-containing protein n=1 Tax=Paramecium pentaurelia TaxID=43138 RepID=A0A8S1VUQ5_9CILI|nr:unnamed protein product [Paramecium pentaurelia]